MRKVVISLHGLKTRGVWQKDLVPLLALDGFIPYALDYGYFVLGFLIGRLRNRKIEWLRDEYIRVTTEASCRRPSVIAHSFGTYLVAKLLEKYPEIRFDKIILCGSIVHTEFDWPRVLSCGQVNLVRNDYGRLDIWPQLADRIVSDAGWSGTTGFTKDHPRLLSKEFRHHEHSDYFHRRHFEEYWLPTLRKVVLNQQDAKEIKDQIGILVRTAAQRLGMDARFVRSNIFVEEERGRLTIPEGLHYQMGRPEEWTISLRVGEGCSGRAFAERKPTIAVFRGGWGKHDVPDSELQKAEPRLRWIVSTPIPDPDLPGSVMGILNLDGLEVTKNPEDLEVLIGDAMATVQIVAARLKAIQ